jgi:hypothetical protein
VVVDAAPPAAAATSSANTTRRVLPALDTLDPSRAAAGNRAEAAALVYPDPMPGARPLVADVSVLYPELMLIEDAPGREYSRPLLGAGPPDLSASAKSEMRSSAVAEACSRDAAAEAWRTAGDRGMGSMNSSGPASNLLSAIPPGAWYSPG